MLELRQADLVADARTIRILFTACRRTIDERLADLGAVGGDTAGTVERAIGSIDVFSPPHGRLVIARMAGEAIGCGTLRRRDDATAELGWLYVRPDRRRRGVGRAIVRRLLAEAVSEGYVRARLELARTMTDARALALAEGFAAVPAFAGTSVSRHLLASWTFLERPLDRDGAG